MCTEILPQAPPQALPQALSRPCCELPCELRSKLRSELCGELYSKRSTLWDTIFAARKPFDAAHALDSCLFSYVFLSRNTIVFPELLTSSREETRPNKLARLLRAPEPRVNSALARPQNHFQETYPFSPATERLTVATSLSGRCWPWATTARPLRSFFRILHSKKTHLR